MQIEEHRRYHERYSSEELEAQYNVRAGRPDFADVLADWAARSAAARANRRRLADIRYGDGRRQVLDIYPAGPQAPVLIYFHGGYWQGGDKSIYSFLAESFGDSGVTVVIPNYDLCPSVRLTRLCEQAREAIAFLWRQGPSLGLARDRVTVSGHSAGGHLAQILAGADWLGLGADLPADLVKAAVPISPLSLLEPVRLTSINDAVKMDANEADRLSPVLSHPPLPHCPVHVVVGDKETAEFKRQAQMYRAAFEGRTTSLLVENVDHFDIVNALAATPSPLFRTLADLCHAAH